MATVSEAGAKAKALSAKMTTPQLFEALAMVDRTDSAHRTVEVWIRGAIIDRDICPDCRGELDEECQCSCTRKEGN